jgi:hypothetical protein
MTELYFSSKKKLYGVRETDAFHFQGADSYLRCLAHVFDLIVGDILYAPEYCYSGCSKVSV